MHGSAGTSVVFRITAQLVILGATVWALGMSAAINYAWGLTQASDVVAFFGLSQAQLVGSGGIIADAGIAILPTVTVWAISKRHIGLALIFGFMCALSLIWVATALYGFFSMSKTETMTQADQAMSVYAMLEDDMKRLKDRRAMVPQHRPATVVAARISEIEGDAKFIRSKQCKDVTLPDSRAFCDIYWGLKAERASSDSAAELDEKIGNRRLDLMRHKKVSSIDALGDSLESLGLSRDDTAKYAPIVKTLLILFMGAFGFTALSFIQSLSPVQAASKPNLPPVHGLTIELPKTVPSLQLAPLPVVVPPPPKEEFEPDLGQVPDMNVKSLPQRPVTAEEAVAQWAKTAPEGWQLLEDLKPLHAAYCARRRLPVVAHLGSALRALGYQQKKISRKGGKMAFSFPLVAASEAVPAKAKVKRA
jgi:hypothetical protein